MSASRRGACVMALLALALGRGCNCDDNTCKNPPPKFIGTGGERVRTLTMPTGVPAVAWTEGSTLYFAQAFNGTWQKQTVYTLPPDGDGVRHTFGLDFDLTIESANLQPAICLVEGWIRPGDTDISESGVLQVLEPGDNGQWQFIGRQGPVRGLGCSLTNYQSQLVVGWSGPRADGGPTPAAYWGKVDRGGQGGDIDDVVTVPIPDDVPVLDRVPWQFQIAGWNDRLYFTYRSSNSMYGGPVAPGTLVAGYFSATHPQGVLGLPCAAAGACVNTVDVQDAVNPTLMVAGDRVMLAYISIPDLIYGPPDGKYWVAALAAPIPIDGQPLAWSTAFKDPFPASGFSGDEVSSVYINNYQSPLDFAAHVRMADSEDATATYIAYEGGSYTVGAAERIMVARVPRNGFTTQDVVDERVSTRGIPAGTPVALDVAAVSGGYRVAYRNPAMNSLAVVDSRVGPMISSSSAASCPQDWHVVHLGADPLALRYQAAIDGSHLLWNSDCYPLSVVPFPVEGEGGEALGAQPSLIEDVLLHVKLRAGRSLLKDQSHVCVPDPIDACDPKSASAGQFNPVVGTSTVSSQLAPFQSSGKATINPVADQAHPSCDAGQLIGDDSSGTLVYSCAVCDGGSLFSPGTGDCWTCPGSTPTYTPGIANQPPPVVLVGHMELLCLACDPGDAAHGVMPGVLSSDGAWCTSCTAGSRLLPCNADSNCDIVGDDYRCTKSDWNGRANAPPRGVCIKKCHSDADCAPGVCDTFNECVLPGANVELPRGTDFACRPIGCESCWNDAYCDSDADCPANHHCTGETTELTPLCPARPLLAPNAPAVSSAVNALPDVAALIADKRNQIVNLLANVRLPSTVSGLHTPPLFGDTLVDFHATVNEIKISMDASDTAPQGGVNWYFGLNEGLVTIANGSVFNPTLNPDPFNFTIAFRPAVGHGSNAPYAYNGFDLPRAILGAEVVVTIFDVDVGPDVVGSLEGSVGSFIDQLMQTILQLIGALDVQKDGTRVPGLTRCLFMPADAAQDLPRQCADGNFEELQLAHITAAGVDLTYAPCHGSSPDGG